MHTSKYTEVGPSYKNCHVDIMAYISKQKPSLHMQESARASAIFDQSIQLTFTQLYLFFQAGLADTLPTLTSTNA